MPVRLVTLMKIKNDLMIFYQKLDNLIYNLAWINGMEITKF